jgi:hypothetical protein
VVTEDKMCEMSSGEWRDGLQKRESIKIEVDK